MRCPPPRFQSAALCCLTVLAVICRGSLAHAAWPHSPFTNLRISNTPYDQSNAAMISDGAGGAILAWSDDRNGSNYLIYAQHVLASGVFDPLWPVNGRAVCPGDFGEGPVWMVNNGAAGAILVWLDTRSNFRGDIYAQHLLASGVIDPTWPATGSPLSAGGLPQQPRICADGAGGVFVTWEDYRNFSYYTVYAQHVLATGKIAAGWPASGRLLCTVASTQLDPSIAADGSGGAFVAWEDTRSGGYDLYAQHLPASGAVDSTWPANGEAVSTAPNWQLHPQVITDGGSGAIVLWQDNRSGPGYSIYAQHVFACCWVDPAWPVNGQAVCATPTGELQVSAIPDGVGGALVAWGDSRSGNSDIYAQHLLASGFADPAWPINGRALCTAAYDQTYPGIVTDDAGGAIVSWNDQRQGAYTGIYSQHVLMTGSIDPAWPADGQALCTAANGRGLSAVVRDGGGGALVTWSDFRGGTYNDNYAQRVERFGNLGSPEPAITSVGDIPADQGGKVRLTWDASYLDAGNFPTISSYWIWRQAPAGAAQDALARGAHRVTGAETQPPPPRSILRTVAAEGQVYYWEYLASQVASGFPGYSFVASTTSDSVTGLVPETYFMVQARGSGYGYWSSAPDSGYSVDNLPPGKPSPFAAVYSGASTTLHWGPNGEADLSHYNLYRGGSEDFLPGAANLVASRADTVYTDAAPGGHCYKLSAVDVHGNESAFALVTPLQSGAVQPGGPAPFWLGQASPNPTRAGCEIRFSLARDGEATLEIFNASGSRVATLASGRQSAGKHATLWDGLDSRGRVAPAGLYFYRLSQGGDSRSGRLVVLR